MTLQSVQQDYQTSNLKHKIQLSFQNHLSDQLMSSSPGDIRYAAKKNQESSNESTMATGNRLLLMHCMSSLAAIQGSSYLQGAVGVEADAAGEGGLALEGAGVAALACVVAAVALTVQGAGPVEGAAAGSGARPLQKETCLGTKSRI